MSIQDKLSKFNVIIKRKLFDFSVDQLGTETKVIRLKTVEDMYEDETISIINDEIITVYLSIPGDLPLTRLRDSVTDEVADSDAIFLYDILPIEGYAPFKDNIEKGDIVIKKIYFENNIKNLYKLLILRVTETLGNISQNRLVWKKFQCAPYTMALPQSIQDIIEEFD